MRVYIAGPMRGIEGYNFPAFDAAAKALREQGWEVVNPAELDRLHGFDGSTPPNYDFIREAIRRDLDAIAGHCHAIALLPGWQDSRGAKLEYDLATMLGLQVLHLNTDAEIVAYDDDGEESILDEAKRLVNGDRNDDYGPPEEDHARTAKLWSALLGIDLPAWRVPQLMIGLKLSRMCNSPTKRDNWVDTAGYAENGWRCVKAGK